MKIHRFYNDFSDFSNNINLSKKDKSDRVRELFNQISNVIKLKEGEVVCFFSEKSKNINHFYKISIIKNKEIVFDFLKKENNTTELVLEKHPNINVFISNIKKDKMEWCVEKSVELGVQNIYPIISERAQNKTINTERLNKIAIEAAEQSGRGGVSKIHNIEKLEDILRNETILKDGVNCVCSIIQKPNQEKHIEKQILMSKNINIFIGPEGGWSEKEEIEFEKNNFVFLNISPTILRTETALTASLGQMWVYLYRLFKN